MFTTMKFNHVALPGHPQRARLDADSPQNIHVSAALALGVVVGFTVEEIPLHRSQIFCPKLFNMDQRPLATAKGKMLESRKLQPFILAVFHQIIRVQVTPTGRAASSTQTL